MLEHELEHYLELSLEVDRVLLHFLVGLDLQIMAFGSGQIWYGIFCGGI